MKPFTCRTARDSRKLYLWNFKTFGGHPEDNGEEGLLDYSIIIVIKIMFKDYYEGSKFETLFCM